LYGFGTQVDLVKLRLLGWQQDVCEEGMCIIPFHDMVTLHVPLHAAKLAEPCIFCGFELSQPAGLLAKLKLKSCKTELVYVHAQV
jgi:hypothetical protein